MGIADYGIASGGAAYSYNTSAFAGSVQIGSALAWGYDPVGKFNTSSVTFQLNVMLIVTNGTANITYWVQGILALATRNSSANFEDEIWNATGARTLAGNAIRGNGSLAGGSYLYVPPRGAGLPGNWVTLAQPANVSIELTTKSIGGVPAVVFEYNDGLGWVNLDTARIAWASGWTDSGFHVDGFRLAIPSVPVFYDAEWVYCGWGGGEIANNNASDLSMALQFWNGHNLQAVPDAYDMGFDTGELMGNVTPILDTYPMSGLPAAHLGAGKGTLGVLYSQTMVARLNVRSPTVPNGTLIVGKSPVQFVGGAINLTLQPGTYRVTLQNGTRPVENRSVSLAPGSADTITMPATESVSLRAVGLPVGTAWSVVVAGGIHSATASTISLGLFNGTYVYQVRPVPGYVPAAYGGTLRVSGPQIFTINFTAFTFVVTGTETGLPAGELWSVAVGSTTYSSSNSTILARFPNGTFAYSTRAASGFVPEPMTGSFTVADGPASFSVVFSAEPGYLTGTLSPAIASLTVNGIVGAVYANGTFNLSLAPGRYEVNATLSGYRGTSSNVTIAPGSVTPLTIALTRLPGSSPTSTQPWSGPTLILAGVGVAVVALAGVFFFSIMRRRRP